MSATPLTHADYLAIDSILIVSGGPFNAAKLISELDVDATADEQDVDIAKRFVKEKARTYERNASDRLVSSGDVINIADVVAVRKWVSDYSAQKDIDTAEDAQIASLELENLAIVGDIENKIDTLLSQQASVVLPPPISVAAAANDKFRTEIDSVIIDDDDIRAETLINIAAERKALLHSNALLAADGNILITDWDKNDLSAQHV